MSQAEFVQQHEFVQSGVPVDCMQQFAVQYCARPAVSNAFLILGTLMIITWIRALLRWMLRDFLRDHN
jgi:hypothetical protein